MNIKDYIKPSYTFKEVYELQKLPLSVKIGISVEVLRRAFELSKHNIALAFSGGKDSQVVADLAERYLPEYFSRMLCIFGNTGIEFPESLKFARKYGFEHFGYADELYKLFRIKKNKYILDSFTDDGTKARMIERFGSTDRLLRDRPCAYDDMGNLVDLTGTGLENEYDAEVMISPDGQLSMI